MTCQLKAYVINPNNWYNKGDSSNRLGLVKALRKEFGNSVTIVVETLTPREDLQYFKKYGVGVVKSLLYIDHANKFHNALRVVKTTKNALLLLFSLVIYRILKPGINLRDNEQTFLRNLVDSDVIISSPGGFLQDYDVFSSLVPNLFLIFLSEVMQKPVIIYAQSIGPFRNRLLRALCKFILNRVDVIILREEISKKYLEEANISKPKVFVTADATFSIDPPNCDRELYRKRLMKRFQHGNGDILVGLTTVGGYFLNRKRFRRLNNYVKSFATAIDYLVDRLNARVVFIPQVSSQSETIITHYIARLVKNKRQVLIVEEDLSPEEIMKLIGCMDLFIGTRMHSNIFALIMNVPIIAIAYEHKTYGIMRMLGLEDWVLEIENINEHDLISKIKELYKKRFGIKELIVAKVKEMQIKSLRSAEIVKNWYFET